MSLSLVLERQTTTMDYSCCMKCPQSFRLICCCQPAGQNPNQWFGSAVCSPSLCSQEIILDFYLIACFFFFFTLPILQFQTIFQDPQAKHTFYDDDMTMIFCDNLSLLRLNSALQGESRVVVVLVNKKRRAL